MKDPESVRTVITTTKRYEFSTDDIEALISEAYKLPKGTRFDWNIGQWASLAVIVTEEKEG